MIAGLAAAGWPLGARAQQPGKSARIGYLLATARDDRLARKNLDAFRQELRELGYIEGQNLVIEQRFAERDFDRLPRLGLAAELVRLKVDIIVASPTPAAVAAKKATDTIPIIMLNTAIPSASGLSPASRGRAATSQGCPIASGWKPSERALSCSRRPSRT